MNIAIFHYQVGGTDGVSLEIDKWKHVLQEMGHKVYLCAGDLGDEKGTLVEEMFHHRVDAEKLYRNTFVALQDYDEVIYQDELAHLADQIEGRLRRFIREKQIDFLIAENIWSVAVNPAVALALRRTMLDWEIPALAHNHDFYWERVDGVVLTCGTAMELADKYLPPRDPLVKQVVINSLAQQELLARKGIESVVVPNVFDFAEDAWTVDDFNKDFRAQIGLSDNDILILQATRIIQRKSIELAVDFVQALGSPERRAQLQRQGLYDGRSFGDSDRIVLVLAGTARDDMGQYLKRLKQKIAASGIDAIFIEERVGGRRQRLNGRKIYSLWDTYVFADFVTYPSIWEGWGNQLLEALQAKLPFLIFEYPVYEVDIKDKGLHSVSLGANLLGRDDQGLVVVADDIIEAAADEAIQLLVDRDLRQKTVKDNFRIAQEHYSLQALQRHLENLVGTAKEAS